MLVLKKINATGNPGCTLFNTECTISAGNTLRIGTAPSLHRIHNFAVCQLSQTAVESHGRVFDNQHPTASRGDIYSQYGETQPPYDYYNYDHDSSLQTTTNTAVAAAGNRRKLTRIASEN